MQDISRRQFIATSAAAGAAASLSVASAAADAKTQASRGDMSFIHLFLPGGWPCNDLWDPKPYSPFRKGMRGSELTSTVGTIATAVPGLFIGAPLFPLVAVMPRATLVRSLVGDTGDVDHLSAQERMLAALKFDQAMVNIEVDTGVDLFLESETVYEHVDYSLSLDYERDEMSNAFQLVSNGTRHVRITFPFKPFQGVDAHESGGTSRRLLPRRFGWHVVDLIEKLVEADLLDRTILCISSEFNRTIAGRPAPGSDLNTGENLIIKDERDYGFHAHFAEANSIVLFGGPFKRGFVYGKTGPKHPMRVVENPVTLADIHATIATALGVPPREGRVIEDLFA